MPARSDAELLERHRHLRPAEGIGKVCPPPSKGLAAGGDEFEGGATVFEPATGLRENVVVLDLKSLYPMAMMTINASPETKNPDGELRAPNGVRFSRKPDGLTRSIIAELLEERDERKRLRNLYPPFGSPEYVLYDLQQNVLKVIMNSYYGGSRATPGSGSTTARSGRPSRRSAGRSSGTPGMSSPVSATPSSTAIPTPVWCRFRRGTSKRRSPVRGQSRRS